MLCYNTWFGTEGANRDAAMRSGFFPFSPAVLAFVASASLVMGAPPADKGGSTGSGAGGPVSTGTISTGTITTSGTSIGTSTGTGTGTTSGTGNSLGSTP